MEIEEIEILVLKMLQDSFDGPQESRDSIDLGSVLLGESAVIDSLSLVNLIVDLEEEINDTCGIAISLTDDEAVFAEPSPYSSVRNLALYISTLVN
jgi:acyl carrier protein